ncbi:MAG: DUF4397 domain-containing protein [Bryobacteraceae bacterium]|nr:DUF4397 domain-containing protein [Bryobacteraceae bacterium]
MRIFAASLALAFLSVAGAFAQSRVRIVHASPDVAKVDILVLGQVAIEALPYAETTDYIPLPLPSGTYPMQVNVSGTSTMLASANVTIASGASYTIVALGLAGPGKSPAFRLVTLPDNRGQEPPDGSAYYRLIHAAPGTGAIDAYALPFAYATTRTSEPDVAGLNFGTATGYNRLAAGPYFMRVTAAGSKTIAADVGRLLLPSRSVRTIIALDSGFLVLPD